MEGGREEDSKEEQRKRLSLFSGRARVRQSAGFGATGRRAGANAAKVAQPGRKPVEGGQGLEQALVETNRKEVFPAPDVPVGNLRNVVRSPRKNRSRGGMILASRSSDMVASTEVLPKFGHNRPSRIPDFNISQACIPRHPELRPAVQVREPQIKEQRQFCRCRVAGASHQLEGSRRVTNTRGELRGREEERKIRARIEVA